MSFKNISELFLRKRIISKAALDYFKEKENSKSLSSNLNVPISDGKGGVLSLQNLPNCFSPKLAWDGRANQYFGQSPKI